MATPPVLHRTLTIERQYPHSPARVFRAFADPKQKLRWFAGGEGVVVEDYALDFVDGGFERTRFRHGDGAPATNDCLYFQILENERIVYAFHIAYGGQALTSSLSTIELIPEGDGTLLRLVEHIAYLNGTEHHDQRIEGTRGLLDRLGADLDLPT
jgi:uncharacterized protein YndB with AHSA1/START domain